MNRPDSQCELTRLFGFSQEHFRRLSCGLAPTWGSMQAVNELFRRLYSIAYLVVSKHLRRPDDREDCTQTVLVEILMWMQRCKFEQQEVEFVPWVCGVAHHFGIKAARTADRGRTADGAAGLLEAHERENAFDPARCLEAIEELTAQSELLERGLRELEEFVSARDLDILKRRLNGCNALLVGTMYHLSADRVRSIQRSLLKKLRCLIKRNSTMMPGKDF